MTPFNALVVTVTTTNPDPLGPTVVDLAAVGARIDPASRHDPVLDFVFETRVDPGRAIPAVLTAFLGIDPEDLKGQPRLPEAIDLLRAKADPLRPDLLATCHPPDVADVLPHLARQLMPRDPHWVSTFRLNCHVSPFDLNWIEQGASCDAGRKVEARGLDPDRPARRAITFALLLARQARALVEAGFDATSATLRAWSEAVPLLVRVPGGGEYRAYPWRLVPRHFCERIVETHRAGGPNSFPPALETAAVATAAAALRGEYAVALADAKPPAGAV